MLTYLFNTQMFCQTRGVQALFDNYNFHSFLCAVFLSNEFIPGEHARHVFEFIDDINSIWPLYLVFVFKKKAYL